MYRVSPSIRPIRVGPSGLDWLILPGANLGAFSSFGNRPLPRFPLFCSPKTGEATHLKVLIGGDLLVRLVLLPWRSVGRLGALELWLLGRRLVLLWRSITSAHVLPADGYVDRPSNSAGGSISARTGVLMGLVGSHSWLHIVGLTAIESQCLRVSLRSVNLKFSFCWYLALTSRRRLLVARVVEISFWTGRFGWRWARGWLTEARWRGDFAAHLERRRVRLLVCSAKRLAALALFLHTYGRVFELAPVLLINAKWFPMLPQKATLPKCDVTFGHTF